MLDRLFIGNTPQEETLFRADYQPQDVAVSSEVINPDGNKLVALFPPWHGGGKPYDIFKHRMTSKNYAVLAFEFDDQQLTHDSDQVLNSFLTIAATSAEKLHALTDSRQYARVDLLGASLGTPALAMTASLFDRFDRATFITPGANLADCVWHGIRTQRVRRELEAAGETYDTINEKWQPIAPVNHTKVMEGKDVRILLSTTDKIIPAQSQAEYVSSLEKAGVNPSVSKSRLGHYGTIARYCLTGKL